MKDKVKIITVALTIALILAIPSLNQMANATREHKAYGGECIIWMLPGLLYMLYTNLREVKEWKKL